MPKACRTAVYSGLGRVEVDPLPFKKKSESFFATYCFILPLSLLLPVVWRGRGSFSRKIPYPPLHASRRKFWWFLSLRFFLSRIVHMLIFTKNTILDKECKFVMCLKFQWLSKFQFSLHSWRKEKCEQWREKLNSQKRPEFPSFLLLR